MSAERTVIVHTWGGGLLVMPEPEWCAGHEGEPQHPGDFLHQGPDIELLVSLPGGGETPLLRLALGSRPLDHAPVHGPAKPYLSVQLLDGDWRAFDPAALRRLSDEMAALSDRLLHMADELEQLRGEDEEPGGES